MALLIIGIVVFLGVHLLPTHPSMRARLIGSLGENGYKVIFSVLSILGFMLLVYGFAMAPIIQIWSPPTWMRHLAILLMLPAFIWQQITDGWRMRRWDKQWDQQHPEATKT